MRRVTLGTAPALLLLVPMTIGQAQEPQCAGALLTGQVVDAESGAPVALAELAIEGTIAAIRPVTGDKTLYDRR